VANEFVKKCPICCPTHFLSKVVHNINCKVAQNVGYAHMYVIKKLPKVNNHPIAENSTNLVTLLGGLATQTLQVRM
jgi:hypothetical protein